jgi:hypothetical protein
MINVTNLVLKIPSFYDSDVGAISLFRIGLFIGTIELGAKAIINKVLKDGISINWIISDLLGIHFIYFEKMTLDNLNELIYFRAIPVFNITLETIEEIPYFNQKHTRSVDLKDMTKDDTYQKHGFEEYFKTKLDKLDF